MVVYGTSCRVSNIKVNRNLFSKICWEDRSTWVRRTELEVYLTKKKVRKVKKNDHNSLSDFLESIWM